MNFSLIWTVPSDNDMDAIVAYISERNPRAALNETDKIIKVAELLVDMPKMGVSLGGDRFYAVVPNTEFTIFYYLNNRKGLVAIVRVLHQSQKLAAPVRPEDSGSPFDLLN